MKSNTVYPKIPTRLYGTTVVSLAVFFTGLIVWRVPVDGYLAVSEVGRRVLAQPDSQDQLTAVADDPLDNTQIPALNQALADAIRFADARLARTEPDLKAEVSEERIRNTHSRLTIDIRDKPECDHTIRISYTGPDPAWSLALVEQLTRECLLATSSASDAHASSARALRDARWRLDQTRHYERKARLSVEGFVDAYFARHTGSGVNGGAVEQMAEGNAGSHLLAEANSTPVRNPQWQQLQDQLAAMAEQLRPLVQHLTPNHPHILDLTQRMDVVRQQLATTPQYLGPDFSTAGDSSAAAEGAAAQASHTAGVAGSSAEDYQSLRKAYEDAIGDREQAEQRLAGLMTRPSWDVQPLAAESRWLITPPTLEGRIGGRPSVRRVGVIGVFALGCGVCVAWLIGTLKGLQRINTVMELERTLSIPVVGQLSIDPVPGSVTRLARRGRVLRGVVFGSEVVLGLMLVVFIAGAIEGNPASQLLRADPFSAIPDTVVQALQKWF